MSRAEEEKFLDRVSDGMARNELVSVAAFHGRRLVGNCDIGRRHSTDVRHTGVLGLVILEEYRGMGLGEELMKTSLAQAQKAGVWAIELEVFATNSTARRLCERLGFKAVGVIPNKMLRDGEFIDSIVMYLHLREK